MLRWESNSAAHLACECPPDLASICPPPCQVSLDGKHIGYVPKSLNVTLQERGYLDAPWVLVDIGFYKGNPYAKVRPHDSAAVPFGRGESRGDERDLAGDGSGAAPTSRDLRLPLRYSALGS